VHAVRVDAEHNYNRESREAMYAWMARWLKREPPETRPTERPFTVDPLQDLLVFHNRALPEGALTAAELTEQWVARARAQLEAAPARFAPTLRHALGFGAGEPAPGARPGSTRRQRTVLVAGTDASLAPLLTRAGFSVQAVTFSPFDAAAAAKVRHFETYNRTAASQRVADLVAAIRATPGAALVASGDAALAGLLARAIADVPLAVLDIDRFDRSSDAAFLDHLDIPGLRRAGDLATAASLAHGKVIVHDAGNRFTLTGVDIRPEQIPDEEIAKTLRSVTR
jgi:hypothetical protein